jgi:ABC-2 type transport system ATP-binding protein
MAENTMIELRNLQKTIDQRTVIAIEALTIQQGEIAAVVGAANSGIPELVSLLIGQTPPTLGTITIAGVDPRAERQAFARQVGVLFADESVYERQSPLANLRFYARLYGVSRERAEEVLKLVGLMDHAQSRLKALTGGMRRRLDFGRAILHDPRVLLLVDPFAGCDEQSIVLMRDLLRRFAAEGRTILILMDDTTHLSDLCDTIYRLEQGKIVSVTHPAEEQPQPVPFKIPARLDENVILLNPVDILYASAEDGRTLIHTENAQYPTQFTLAELETRLVRSGFFRAHRSYLVNLQHVKEVIPYTRNSFSLRLIDAAGTKIPLSKSSAAELRELFGY